VALLMLSYLTGSIATAILVCKLLTLPDPRVTGSHNPGATNVHRIGGKKAALLTLLGDMAKAALPLSLGVYLGMSQVQLAWLGVAAIVGHCFPIYYGFRGGKGVASMAAVLLFIAWPIAVIMIGSWLIAIWTYRKAGIAAVICAIALPAFTFNYYYPLFVPVTLISLLILLRHKSNIRQLLRSLQQWFAHPSVKD